MAAAPNPFDELQKRKAEEARKEPESKRDAKTELALAAVKFQKRAVDTLAEPRSFLGDLKFADACAYFERAAELFICSGRWRQAGDAYIRCGECENLLGNTLISATFYSQAGKAMSKVDPGEALKCYRHAVERYSTVGRMVQAAVMELECASILEGDAALNEAAMAYQFASEYYKKAGCFTQTVVYLERAADLLVDAEEYLTASNRYKRAARLCLDDNLLKARSPAVHLNAVLSLLADLDLQEAKDYVLAQLDDFLFQSSREKRFIMDILFCIQETDPDMLLDHTWNYDYVVELTDRQLGMLEAIHDSVVASKPKPSKAMTIDERAAMRVQQAVDEAASDSGSAWGSDSASTDDSDSDDGPAPQMVSSPAATGAGGAGRRGSAFSGSQVSSLR